MNSQHSCCGIECNGVVKAYCYSPGSPAATKLMVHLLRFRHLPPVVDEQNPEENGRNTRKRLRKRGTRDGQEVFVLTFFNGTKPK